MKTNKKRVVLCLAALAFFSIVLMVALWVNSNMDIVFYINEVPVYKEELLMVGRSQSVIVRHELQRTYLPEQFLWESNFDDKTGYEILADSAIKELTAQKMIQILGYDNNLLDSLKYPDIVKTIEENNKNNREKKSRGEVVFGLVQMSNEEGYEYINNNIVIQLVDSLYKNGRINYSQEELQQYYLENKDYFLNNDFEEVRDHVAVAVLKEKTDAYIKAAIKTADIRRLNEKEVAQVLKQVA